MNKIFKTLSLSILLLAMSSSIALAEASKAEIDAFNALAKEHPELIVDLFSKDKSTFHEVYYQTARDHRELFVSVFQAVDEQLRAEALMEGWKNDIKTSKVAASEGRPTKGRADAPITLYAFSDFTCSYCANGAANVEELLRLYPNDIRYTFKSNVDLDSPYAVKASLWFLAAYNIDEVKAWNFYRSLYANQSAFFADPDNTLIQIARQIGLNTKDIEKNLDKNEKKYMALIKEDIADAQKLDFIGTPYFLMNDITIRGAVPVTNFVDAYNFVLENNKK